jgi:hypothetical protein
MRTAVVVALLLPGLLSSATDAQRSASASATDKRFATLYWERRLTSTENAQKLQDDLNTRVSSGYRLVLASRGMLLFERRPQDGTSQVEYRVLSLREPEAFRSDVSSAGADGYRVVGVTTDEGCISRCKIGAVLEKVGSSHGPSARTPANDIRRYEYRVLDISRGIEKNSHAALTTGLNDGFQVIAMFFFEYENPEKRVAVLERIIATEFRSSNPAEVKWIDERVSERKLNEIGRQGYRVAFFGAEGLGSWWGRIPLLIERSAVASAMTEYKLVKFLQWSPEPEINEAAARGFRIVRDGVYEDPHAEPDVVIMQKRAGAERVEYQFLDMDSTFTADDTAVEGTAVGVIYLRTPTRWFAGKPLKTLVILERPREPAP